MRAWISGKRERLMLVSVSVFAIANPAFAHRAAGDASASNDSSEIIVTAQKRAENIRSVPIAITAATGDQLKDRGIKSPADLTSIVPSFGYQLSWNNTPIYSIRGVGFYDIASSGSPTVSLYANEVPIAYSVEAKGASLDIAQVEVLKGPQGTLFGQNATGGAIDYKPARPTDSFTAGTSIDYGRFNDVKIEGYISGAIASDVRARLAVSHESMDGWQKSFTTNDVIAGVTPGRTNGRKLFTAGRITLEATPTSNLKFTLYLNGWKDTGDSQAMQFQGFLPKSPRDPFNGDVYAILGAMSATPKNARLAGWAGNLRHDDWFYQPALRAEYSVAPSVKLTSITSYADFRERHLNDQAGTPYANLQMSADHRYKSFYQELRLNGESGQLKWMIGGNYAHDHTRDHDLANTPITGGGVGPFRFQNYFMNNDQKVKTWGAFGSADYKLSNTLTLQGSLRYTKQDRTYTGCTQDPGDGTVASALNFLFGTVFGATVSPLMAAGKCVVLNEVVPLASYTVPSQVTLPLNEGNVSWRGSLNWKPNNDTLVYASVTRGYKAGGFSVFPATLVSQLSPAKQEELTSYELGLKAAFLNDAVQFDSALFYYDYRDKQLLGSTIIIPFGFLPRLVNIPKSRAYGVEGSLLIKPVKGMKVTLGGTYMNTRVGSDPQQGQSLDFYGAPVSYIGEAFPNTPEFRGIADVEYHFGSDGVQPYIGASTRLQSSTYAAFGNNLVAKIDSYGIVDLRAGVKAPDGKWKVQVYGRNIMNKFYYNNVAYQGDAITDAAGMPSTYGVLLSIRY